MKQVYVPKEEITTYPDGWNEGCYNHASIITNDDNIITKSDNCQSEIGIESFYSAFLFLKDPREDIYSL